MTKVDGCNGLDCSILDFSIKIQTERTLLFLIKGEQFKRHKDEIYFS